MTRKLTEAQAELRESMAAWFRECHDRAMKRHKREAKARAKAAEATAARRAVWLPDAPAVTVEPYLESKPRTPSRRRPDGSTGHPIEYRRHSHVWGHGSSKRVRPPHPWAERLAAARTQTPSQWLKAERGES